MKSILKYLQESVKDVPNEILKKLSNIQYDNSTDDDKYIIKSPDEVLRKRKAICYDIVELQRELLTKAKYETRTYFFYEKLPVIDNPTHTIIIFKENNKYFWMESSWQSYKGIHGPFNSYKDGIEYVKKQLQWKSVNVIEYNKFNYKNMNINQFAEYIIKTF